MNIFKKEKWVGLNKLDHSKSFVSLSVMPDELANHSLVQCTPEEIQISKKSFGLQELLM